MRAGSAGFVSWGDKCFGLCGFGVEFGFVRQILLGRAARPSMAVAAGVLHTAPDLARVRCVAGCGRL